jgi:predicted chitinase
LKLDLLNNPDQVSQKQDVAVNTAVWFFRTNKMVAPARKGDFAATTKIINGKLECKGGSEYPNQKTRVATYKRVRTCFGLGAPKKNPMC